MATPRTIEEVNGLDRDAFVAALGHLFEGTPGIAAKAWEARPFADRDALHRALCDVMWALAPAEQEALIKAHPDLAGRAAIAGELTPDSAREQASARLDRLTPDEYATFHRLNAAYRERFGFPFVICVREHTQASILAQFAARLDNDRDAEVATALGEIAKIAGLRLRDAVRDA